MNSMIDLLRKLKKMEISKNISNQKEEKVCKWLIYIIGLECFIMSLAQLISRLTNTDIFWNELFKVLYISEFLICVYFHFRFRNKFRINTISILFFSGLLLGCVLGIINGQINNKFIIHIYAYVMPIISMSMGYWLLKSLENSELLYKLFVKMFRVNAWAYCILAILFRIAYLGGATNYWAYGASAGMYAIAFFATSDCTKDTLLSFFCLVAIAISGKRGPLVVAACIYIIQLIFIKRTSKQKCIQILLLIFAIFGVIYFLRNTSIFNRIILTISNLFGENKDLSLATGGRNTEVEYIVNYMNNFKISWIIGYGFGIKIWVGELYRHYSHFTPLGYTMISGIVFSIFLYGKLFYYSCKSLFNIYKRKVDSKIRFGIILMCAVIINSFFGGILFNNCYCWIYIGMGIATIDKSYKKFAVN